MTKARFSIGKHFLSLVSLHTPCLQISKYPQMHSCFPCSYPRFGTFIIQNGFRIRFLGWGGGVFVGKGLGGWRGGFHNKHMEGAAEMEFLLPGEKSRTLASFMVNCENLVNFHTMPTINNKWGGYKMAG